MAIVLVILLIVMFLAEFVTGVDTWLFFLLMFIIIVCGVYLAVRFDDERRKYWL